jgi:hypothetical protein
MDIFTAFILIICLVGLVFIGGIAALIFLFIQFVKQLTIG